MSKKNGKKSETKSRAKNEPALDPRVKKEMTAIGLGLLAILSLLAFFGSAGPAGKLLDEVMGALFGVTKWMVPIVLGWAALRIAFPERLRTNAGALLGAFLLLASFSGFLNVLAADSPREMLVVGTIRDAGGYVGLLLGYTLVQIAGSLASLAILVGLILCGVVLTFNVSIHDLAVRALGAMHFRWPWPVGHLGGVKNHSMDGGIQHAGSHERQSELPLDEDAPSFTRKDVAHEHDAPTPGNADAAALSAGMKKRRSKPVTIPLELLEVRGAKPNSGDVQGKMYVIKKTLENFGIPVEMGDVSVGPTVTQFALKPADGIKLNKITTLSNDLALALAAHPIRIEAPIPGKSLVGIEVPNQAVAVVSLREVLESKEFSQRPSNLTFGLGKDVAGKPWTLDLGKMPHLLVAGATGSGKSVCLNTIIVSLIYTNSPDDLKLLLIDPKRVEMPVYNGIPHLIVPAVTEVPKIINSLKWALGEMDRRFELLSKAGKRDIGSYNEQAEERMPYLVIVIDELADLMVASAAEVETAIIRLAQLARAVGIHLVVATQRPSVDVITGLIKANITARIAFSVASATDSRTILDQPGAEKLVGRGDSLVVTSDLSMPKRVQGCFVSDTEIRKVVGYLQEQLEEPVHYEEGVTERRGPGGMSYGFGDDEDAELFEQARSEVVRAGKASTSFLQRRLKLGYSKAARIMDLLEERGIIGPGDGAKPRQVLVGGVMDEDGVHFNDSDDSEG